MTTQVLHFGIRRERTQFRPSCRMWNELLRAKGRPIPGQSSSRPLFGNGGGDIGGCMCYRNPTANTSHTSLLGSLGDAAVPAKPCTHQSLRCGALCDNPSSIARAEFSAFAIVAEERSRSPAPVRLRSFSRSATALYIACSNASSPSQRIPGRSKKTKRQNAH